MSARKILFWLHLSAGVCAGIVILIMSVTGVLLAYEHQILNWSTRNYRSFPPSPDTQRLPVAALLAKAGESHPDLKPTGMTIYSDPSAPAAVRLGRDITVYVNPYTATVYGEGSKNLQSFFQSIEYWHRWLALKGESRTIGRVITGWSNLFFAVLVCSGPFLWWPRNWSPANLRNVTFFRKGLSGKARNFNWHNTIGLWCAIPLICIVLSGVVMSFPWANDLLYKITGSPVPARPAAQTSINDAPRTGARRARGSAEAPPTNPDALWLRAEQQLPDWRTISLRIQDPTENTVAFTIDQGDGGRPDKRATLTLDTKTGDVVRWEPFASYNLGRRMRTWARFSHTGEAGGFAGESVALIASLGAAFLVWTGLALVLRRLLGWAGRRKRSESRQPASGEPVSNVQA